MPFLSLMYSLYSQCTLWCMCFQDKFIWGEIFDQSKLYSYECFMSVSVVFCVDLLFLAKGGLFYRE